MFEQGFDRQILAVTALFGMEREREREYHHVIRDNVTVRLEPREEKAML